MQLTKKQNKEIGDLLAKKFIDYLIDNNIECEDEDEVCCIFDQLVGEQIELNQKTA